MGADKMFPDPGVDYTAVLTLWKFIKLCTLCIFYSNKSLKILKTKKNPTVTKKWLGVILEF